jgi:predicted metal-dependent hydrolase
MRFFEPRQLTEPLDGPDGDFLRSIIDDRPDLLLLEFHHSEVPPHPLVHLLKTSAATRRIPILAVVPSKNDTQASRQSAADQIISMDAWREGAAGILADWADRLDEDRSNPACSGALHPLAAQGVEAVNAGEYYQAHELLEEAWMAVDEAEGTLYRALLQVSVTYLQLERRNLRGALKMLLRMRQWLDPLPVACRGIDVHHLRLTMASLQQTLETLDLNQKPGILPEWFQPIPFSPTAPRRSPGWMNKKSEHR